MKIYYRGLFIQNYGGCPGKLVLEDNRMLIRAALGIYKQSIDFSSIKLVTYTTIYHKLKIEYYNNGNVESIIIFSALKYEILREFQSKNIDCIKYSNPNKNLIKKIKYWFEFWD